MADLDPAPVLELMEAGSLLRGEAAVAEPRVEVAGSRRTWLAGRETGHVPVNIDGLVARYVFQPLLFGLIGHHVLTVKTPVGRRLRPRLLAHGAPLVRIKPKDFAAARVERVPRVVGVRDGLPVLEDGRTLDVGNVIWCTGFRPDFSWIDLPVFEGDGREPTHRRGIVDGESGLYFVGLFFLYAMSSGFFRGVGRDAGYVVKTIAARKD